MSHLTFPMDLSLIDTYSEKSENIDSLNEDFNNVKLEECFAKIFAESKIIDIDSDNELDFFIREKPCLEVNDIRAVQNKENTLDISKIKSQQIKNKEVSSSNFGSNKSILYYKNNTIENLNIVIEPDEKIETNKDSPNLLGRKRNFFKIDCPKDFHIFNCGQYNKYSRNIIEEVLGELSNKSKEKEEGTKSGIKATHKKIKNVQKRKENADNIRKKIKSRFLKVLRYSVNEKLKIAGSKKYFRFLPQKFISNVSKEKNKAALDFTFKEIFSNDFSEGKPKAPSELSNYYHNLEVLKYLEQNNDIEENSNFNVIKNMKYYEIYNEYIKSKEFEIEIASLKQQKESDKYIKDYIIIAFKLIDFFSN